jgi:hypothetical protein
MSIKNPNRTVWNGHHKRVKAEISRFTQAAQATAKSNGKTILPMLTRLPAIDGRTMVGRRYRDIAAAITTDQGGEGRCSETRIQLIRRFAAAAVIAETLEARLVDGEQIDIYAHALLSSTMVRIARRIGLKRLPKNVTADLDLSDYISQRSHGRGIEQSGAPDECEVLPPEDDLTSDSPEDLTREELKELEHEELVTPPEAPSP